MNEKNTKYLYEKYPTIFGQVINRPKKVKVILPIYFGLEVGDGWFNIIDGLCRQLAWIEETYGVRTIADQVKEKFGGLRFYNHVTIDGKAMTVRKVKMPDGKEKWIHTWHINQGRKLTKPEKNFDMRGLWGRIDGMVEMAGEMSYRTCEICGNPGKPNSEGWITTLCDKCRAEIDKQRAKEAARLARQKARRVAWRKKWDALTSIVQQRRIARAEKQYEKLNVQKGLTKAEAVRCTHLADFLWEVDKDYMRKHMDERLALLRAGSKKQ